MKKLILAVTAMTAGAFGLVDTINGNYSKTFVDFELKGAAFPLKLERTYNSRSLYKGLFGMGWCSNIETRVDILPDGTPQMTVCGGGLEVAFLSKNKKQNIPLQVKEIISVVKAQNKTLSRSYFSQLEKKLLTSKVLRNEFLRAYKIKGKPQAGTLYSAEGRRNDTLEYNPKGFWKRTLPNGSYQFFNKETGHLIQMSDRVGNYIKFTWKNNKPQSAIDNKGKKVTFLFKEGEIQIAGLGKKLAIYRMDGEKLTRIANQDGLYIHEYDDLFNLTKTIYPGKDSGGNVGAYQAIMKKASKTPAGPSESLTYNTKKDWVTSFTNQRGCVEKYDYKTNSKNKNHFWANVEKKCGKVVTNKSRYEFWNKKAKDGSLYLHRARQDVNGAVKDITYHPAFKRPLSVSQNNITTKYDFYSNGLLKNKMMGNQKINFKQYHTKCRKPGLIIVENKQGKKVIGKQTIDINYNSTSCLMDKVSHSDGRWVSLSRDANGRIALMKDQSGRQVDVNYNDFTDRPSVITQKGVGSITLEYDKKTGQSKGLKKGSDFLVASQVMRVFNSFLEIVRPVAGEVSI